MNAFDRDYINQKSIPLLFLISALNLGFPGAVFRSNGVVNYVLSAGAGIVWCWFTPEFLWLDVHFGRGFLNNLGEPHVPTDKRVKLGIGCGIQRVGIQCHCDTYQSGAIWAGSGSLLLYSTQRSRPIVYTLEPSLLWNRQIESIIHTVDFIIVFIKLVADGISAY